MKTLEEQLEDLNTYLKKLKRVITTECSLNLGKTKIVNRARIDDVLCCIQASYPEDYTDFVKRNGIKKLETYLCFQQLLSVATKKFLFSSKHYSINYPYLESLIKTFMQTAKKEMKTVIEDSSFKL